MRISKEDILEYHMGGKIGVRLCRPIRTVEDLSKAYTPGVAVPVKEIARDRSLLRDYTAKQNLVAVVTDGTAILGLGDLGAEASIPVMEGKAALFKAFADVDGWPVPLNCARKGGGNRGPTDPARVIDAVCMLAPMYGGINLEDIAAPACFEIEDKLRGLLDIPVFHDDQWGTAVITLAGVLNYCVLSGRKAGDLRIAINGAGAAGIRIADMLKAAGAVNVVLCDTKGVVSSDRTDLNEQKRSHAVMAGCGTLAEALRGAHVFIGVSAPDVLKREDVLGMADFPAIFAMSNPDPEIRPEVVAECMGGREYVMATGRSDYANQVNNVLGFPFLFRGALDARASDINAEMKVAAAESLARLAREPAPDEVAELYDGERLEFGSGYIIPKPFDRRLFVEIPYAVACAGASSGVAPELDRAAYRALLERRNAARSWCVKS